MGFNDTPGLSRRTSILCRLGCTVPLLVAAFAVHGNAAAMPAGPSIVLIQDGSSGQEQPERGAGSGSDQNPETEQKGPDTPPSSEDDTEAVKPGDGEAGPPGCIFRDRELELIV
jgi:hypothetical protein